MLSHQLPPYQDVINFGCLLDIMSTLPIKKASEGTKESADKFHARASYDDALRNANDLTEITEIVYEMLDIGLYPIANFLKILLDKLYKLKQYHYVIQLYNILHTAGIINNQLINHVLQSCRHENNCKIATEVFDYARQHHLANPKFYQLMLYIMTPSPSHKHTKILALLKDAQALNFDTDSVYAATLHALQRKHTHISVAINIYNTAKEKRRVNPSVINRMLKICLQSKTDSNDTALGVYTYACMNDLTDKDTHHIYHAIESKINEKSADYTPATKESATDKAPDELIAQKNKVCSFGFFSAAAKVAAVTAAITVTGWAITKTCI